MIEKNWLSIEIQCNAVRMYIRPGDCTVLPKMNILCHKPSLLVSIIPPDYFFINIFNVAAKIGLSKTPNEGRKKEEEEEEGRGRKVH